MTPPVPVGVAVRPTQPGWGWVVRTPNGGTDGLFQGSWAELSHHLAATIDACTGSGSGPVVCAVDQGGLRRALVDVLGDPIARPDGTASQEEVVAAKQLSALARRHVAIRWPERLHGAVDYNAAPPLYPPPLDTGRLGRIACDASMGPDRTWGGWAVATEAGWFATGRVHDAHGRLTSQVLELLAVRWAVHLTGGLHHSVDIYSDNRSVIDQVQQMRAAPHLRHAYQCAPLVPVTVTRHLWGDLRSRPAPMRIQWRPRNSTPTLAWADDLSRRAREGAPTTVETVVDLTGHQQQNDRFTAPPETARPFLDAAADQGWAVESTRARPVRGGRRVTYTTVLRRARCRLTATWTRSRTGWSHGLFMVDEGRGEPPYRVPWQRAREALQ